MQVMDSILQALTNSGVRDKGGKAVQNVQQILGQLFNPISAPITFSSLSGDSGGSASTPYYEIEDERGYINQRNPSYEGWDKDIWNAQPPYMLSDLDLARMYQQAIIADARNSFKGYWNPGNYYAHQK